MYIFCSNHYRTIDFSLLKGECIKDSKGLKVISKFKNGTFIFFSTVETIVGGCEISLHQVSYEIILLLYFYCNNTPMVSNVNQDGNKIVHK